MPNGIGTTSDNQFITLCTTSSANRSRLCTDQTFMVIASLPCARQAFSGGNLFFEWRDCFVAKLIIIDGCSHFDQRAFFMGSGYYREKKSPHHFGLFIGLDSVVCLPQTGVEIPDFVYFTLSLVNFAPYLGVSIPLVFVYGEATSLRTSDSAQYRSKGGSFLYSRHQEINWLSLWIEAWHFLLF